MSPWKEGEKREDILVKDAKIEFCTCWKYYLDSEILIHVSIVDEKLNNHSNPQT